MRILTLALGVPFPPLGGGLTRTFHLLKSLAPHHEVTLAAFTYGEPHDPPPYPIDVVTVPWQWSDAYQRMTGPDAEASREAFEQLTYHDEEPWFASVLDPTGMERTIEQIVRARQPDLILLEGTPLARFIPALPAGIPRVLDLFDVHTLMTRRSLERASADEDQAALAHEAERTFAFERKAVQRCDACLAVSDDDADAAMTLLGGSRVHIIPNGVDTSYFTPSSVQTEPGAIVFTGRMSYAPNADAACFFAREVMPLVTSAIPNARFHIVGAAPPPHVSALGSAAVVVHGRVEDVRPYLWNAEVAVVPVREGGGTRLKLLEAAASGKAIVSTRVGAEGLAFCAPRDLVLADLPGEIAGAVVELLRDPPRRQLMGSRARFVAHQYDWSAIGSALRKIVEEMVPRT